MVTKLPATVFTFLIYEIVRFDCFYEHALWNVVSTNYCTIQMSILHISSESFPNLSNL